MAVAGMKVAIIGGGIGGLTVALAIAARGGRAVVYEQADALSEVGAGVQITPNGARVLEALGLARALDAASLRAEAVEPMDALTGRAVTRFDLTQIKGPAYRFMHRADLIGVLAQACADAGVEVQLGSRVDLATERNEIGADLFVGADGIKSACRPLVVGARDAFFTGQVAWRAIVPQPAGLSDPVARIWMAPGRHIVTYPLSGGRLNVVAVQERDDWAAEGWQQRDDPDNLRAAFQDASSALRDVLAHVQEVNLWGLYRHEIAKRWHRDHIVLLGDAAHPTLPFLAQGANLAIEDAWVLAACLDDGIAPGLARYEAKRAPRVRRAIAAANTNARNYHASGITRSLSHMGLKSIGKIAPDAFFRRMDWLYGHDVTEA